MVLLRDRTRHDCLHWRTRLIKGVFSHREEAPMCTVDKCRRPVEYDARRNTYLQNYRVGLRLWRFLRV